jgi:hypothetical protein
MCQQNVFKLPSIKFYGNPLSGSRVLSCIRTDGQSEYNRRSAGFGTRLKIGIKREITSHVYRREVASRLCDVLNLLGKIINIAKEHRNSVRILFENNIFFNMFQYV